jgi:hypothetical protein
VCVCVCVWEEACVADSVMDWTQRV